jgi:hypothetical protein
MFDNTKLLSSCFYCSSGLRHFQVCFRHIRKQGLFGFKEPEPYFLAMNSSSGFTVDVMVGRYAGH